LNAENTVLLRVDFVKRVLNFFVDAVLRRRSSLKQFQKLFNLFSTTSSLFGPSQTLQNTVFRDSA